jgi:hypothetical protein
MQTKGFKPEQTEVTPMFRLSAQDTHLHEEDHQCAKFSQTKKSWHTDRRHDTSYILIRYWDLCCLLKGVCYRLRGCG